RCPAARQKLRRLSELRIAYCHFNHELGMAKSFQQRSRLFAPVGIVIELLSSARPNNLLEHQVKLAFRQKPAKQISGLLGRGLDLERFPTAVIITVEVILKSPMAGHYLQHLL